MLAAKDNPRNREGERVSVKTGVEAGFDHVVLKIKLLRSENRRQTAHDRDNPSDDHLPLCANKENVICTFFGTMSYVYCKKRILRLLIFT